jgi:2-polyprenyl-6-methoxyphenol hydroxylase-like FAD-dependent oxidoreductase
MTTSPLPIEIIGGGLAGLALGCALRRSGVPVTIFEAADYPRHRVCGEFISGLQESTIHALKLRPFLADARPHRVVHYHLRDRPLPAFSLPTTAWGISRHTLDARVARAFVTAGGNLLTNTRMSEDEAPPGRVFAVGRHRHGPFWVGLKVHIHNLKLAEDFEVHLGDHAYLGLSIIESGAVNLCGIFASRPSDAHGIDLLFAYLAVSGLNALAGRLRHADLDPATFCVTAAPLGDRHPAPPDRVRVGDAWATIPPFTGNGLAMALQGAEIAVEPLRAYSAGEANWDATARRIYAAQRRRFRRRLTLANWLHPMFLEPRLQPWLARLVSARLVPFRLFYAALR